MTLITLLSWLPLHIFKKIKTFYLPNDYEKIMKIRHRIKSSFQQSI